METCLQGKTAYCVINNQAFQQLDTTIKQSTLHWICGMPKHLSELCYLLDYVKGYVCCEMVNVMGHFLGHRTHITEYNILVLPLVISVSFNYLFVEECHSSTIHWNLT